MIDHKEQKSFVSQKMLWSIEETFFFLVIIRSEEITFQTGVLLQKVSGVIPMGLLFGTRYLPLFRFQVTYHLYCKSGVIVFISSLRLGCTFREGESSREITTLKMEIQQIMKGEVPAYLERWVPSRSWKARYQQIMKWDPSKLWEVMSQQFMKGRIPAGQQKR